MKTNEKIKALEDRIQQLEILAKDAMYFPSVQMLEQLSKEGKSLPPIFCCPAPTGFVHKPDAIQQ
jgi:hypothetical protein